MVAARARSDLGFLGAALDLLLAALLGIFLLVATDSRGDALPRPVILAVLFGVPGLIGLLGVRSRRPSLLVGAALPLFPGAFLSWSGATLPFVLAAVFMLIGALRMPGGATTMRDMLLGAVVAALIAALVVTAGWAALIGLTEPGCVLFPGGESCSSAFVTLGGLLVGAACLGGALALAAWSAGLHGLSRRPS